MKKSEHLSVPTLYACDKGSKSSQIKASIKALFLSGQKLTAKEINNITGGNDARKVISILRQQGINIVDLTQSDRTKLYWLADDDRQLPLVDEKGGDQ